MKLLIILSILSISGCWHCMSPEEQQRHIDNKIKVQKSVSKWITDHALYPDSYEPVSFGEFSESCTVSRREKIPDTEVYVIKHTHKILDKDSNLTTFSGYFILNYDYSVNIIETERTNLIPETFPPQTEIWTNQFGRPENHQDSLIYEQKKKQVLNKMINELKEGLKKGDIQTNDPKDMNLIQDVIDSLEMLE